MSTIKVDAIATRTGSGNITVSNNIAGAGTISGTNISASGTLAVTGAATLSSTAAITGNVTLNSGLVLTSDSNAAKIQASGNDIIFRGASDNEKARIKNTNAIVDAGGFTGDVGVSYGSLHSGAIGDSNVPYNSWGTPNNVYYRWVLPYAGTYKLMASMRIRLWGVHGMLLSRLYNNTTSTVIADINSGASTRMNLENRGGGTAETLNIQIAQEWYITTAADNQDIHHQLFTDNNSTNSSVQSDTNGYNVHHWQRIG